jgi:hypothetical protein
MTERVAKSEDQLRAKRALQFAVLQLGVAEIDIDATSLRDALISSVGEYLSEAKIELSGDLMMDLTEEARTCLGRAVLAFGWQSYKTPKNRIGERLSQFSSNLERLIRVLGTVDEILESAGPKREKIDLEVLRFIAIFAPDFDGRTNVAFEKYRAARSLIEPMFANAKAAVAAFDDLPNGGRPELREYDHVVEAALYIAHRLGIKATIAGDRGGVDADSPYSTPFTRLVYLGLERFLPEDILEKPRTLSGCAKRIERSVLWRKHRGLD